MPQQCSQTALLQSSRRARGTQYSVNDREPSHSRATSEPDYPLQKFLDRKGSSNFVTEPESPSDRRADASPVTPITVTQVHQGAVPIEFSGIGHRSMLIGHFLYWRYLSRGK
jgi:hypothetical protein